ncbi:hypothetical protein D3C83_332830 [compost metagenome]
MRGGFQLTKLKTSEAATSETSATVPKSIQRFQSTEFAANGSAAGAVVTRGPAFRDAS